MSAPRVVVQETLDQLAPEHPDARRSRRDLLRLHRAMATQSLLVRGWRRLLEPMRPSGPLRILELGAGDGLLLLGVARELAPRWPHVHLTLLDRVDIVSAATLSRYAALGWTVQVRCADVLAWAAPPAGARPAPPRVHWDLITTSLFLHHFDAAPLARLLAAAAARGDRFFACEPRRAWWPRLGSHLVGALGANAVTREDAVLSVRAGFRGAELTAAWPATGGWQIDEGPAGLFSHGFSAKRAGVA